jgi:hypothetical protein
MRTGPIGPALMRLASVAAATAHVAPPSARLGAQVIGVLYAIPQILVNASAFEGPCFF